MRFTAASEVRARINYQGKPLETAAAEVIAELRAAGGEGGLIAIDARHHYPSAAPGWSPPNIVKRVRRPRSILTAREVALMMRPCEPPSRSMQTLRHCFERRCTIAGRASRRH